MEMPRFFFLYIKINSRHRTSLHTYLRINSRHRKSVCTYLQINSHRKSLHTYLQIISRQITSHTSAHIFDNKFTTFVNNFTITHTSGQIFAINSRHCIHPCTYLRLISRHYIRLRTYLRYAMSLQGHHTLIQTLVII